ncbi:DUF6440 family protein [Nesterenkonia halobia]|uniref:DUF6440 domain-containing protein n=1 Tax=Nesterenkonia halobia TaxID=37922 RepID=A0ABP6RB73_9MICC
MENDRFQVELEEKSMSTLTQVLVDNETGVRYLFRQVGAASGMTLLVGEDGLPA